MFTEGDLIGLAGVYCYVGSVIAVTWAFRRRFRNPRKTIHIATGGIVFFWWTFDTGLIMAGLAAFPFVPLLLLATPRSPIGFLRRSLLGATSSEGHPYGLVLYAVSWTLVAYCLFDDLFAASVAIAAMSFGDGMGDLVGRRFGRTQFLEGKTAEGSLAVFAATAASVLALRWFYFDVIEYSGSTPPEMDLLFAFALAGLVTLLEAATPGAADNLVIPLALGGYLHVLGA